MKIKVIGSLLCALFLALILMQNSLLSKPKKTAIPLAHTIVAPATVDAFNDIMRIPTLQPGVIQQIEVSVGQQVKKGQPLFSLDAAIAMNEVNIQSINLEQTKNDVQLRENLLLHAKAQLSRLQSLDKRAISSADLQEKKHEVDMLEIQVTEAHHHEALAMAHLKRGQLILQQYNVVAPNDGIILQINGHIHEAVNGGQIILLLGDAQKVMVRVSLDERDSQQFNPQAHTFITSNDHPSLKIPLTFVQLDQYIITQERLNSRVQEALYYFKRAQYPNVVAGQQFDANIEVAYIHPRAFGNK
ncbi:MAG: efflux RND transporter periplasmic adaptor subunit [Legionellales bacterium]|nr:efflux RND transporter periplasmic adaptor subunit [Legionellales bacterium]